MFGWLQNSRGVTGLLAGLLMWVASAWALGLSMQANLDAAVRGRLYSLGATEVLVRHLHGAAVAWSFGFTVLQLLSLLATTFALRACYRLRTAVCFAMGAGFVMLGDVLGLLGLLVWLGMTPDAR